MRRIRCTNCKKLCDATDFRVFLIGRRSKTCASCRERIKLKSRKWSAENPEQKKENDVTGQQRYRAKDDGESAREHHEAYIESLAFCKKINLCTYSNQKRNDLTKAGL